ncbi:MAG TPA: type II toxin-antitoxin system RelE/ParE family toxin [Nitrospirota bacterium]|nr:type II toxin-antitoxin system RelE/ParE family toxin [Nitrospirota bacterium]
MGKVIWAPSALEDVNSIAEYIARDSVDRSALFVMRLIEATDRLQEFPLSGRVIHEISDPSCREIIYGTYRIMYRLVKAYGAEVFLQVRLLGRASKCLESEFIVACVPAFSACEAQRVHSCNGRGNARKNGRCLRSAAEGIQRVVLVGLSHRRSPPS